MDSLKRTRSTNTGSLSSNASSIRKRFGFGTSLSRENSRSEAETKIGSVWRTLSKNTRGFGDADSQPPSLSKSFLSRSRSTDTDNRLTSLPRPVSQDRSPSPSSSLKEEKSYRPGSAHNTLSKMTTIGEGPPPIASIPPRRKRRSSLSDLVNGASPGQTYISSPAQLRSINSPENINQKTRNAVRTPSPTKLPAPPGMEELSPPRLEPFNRKENYPIPPRQILVERSVNGKSDETVAFSQILQNRNDISTGIPVLKPGLHKQRSPSPCTNGSPKRQGSSPQKLRLQSPQKVGLSCNMPKGQ